MALRLPVPAPISLYKEMLGHVRGHRAVIGALKGRSIDMLHGVSAD